MASKLPTVSHSGEGYGQEVSCTNSVSKVLISIDDTALLHSPVEAARARSLNRLDNFDEGDPGIDIYRCPSFPRLQKRCGSQIDSQTNCSMTHLETNSISPRVSTDNLTNISRDDADSGDILEYVTGYAGLMRSVSSKTVDELPPLDFPVSQFERLGHHYLSPQQANVDKTPQPVSRSTSCPSMAYVRRSPSPCPARIAPPTPNPEQRAQVGGVPGVRDEPNELNADAGASVPDGSRPQGRDVQEGPSGAGRASDELAFNNICEEHPMHTKRLLEKQRVRLSLIKQNGEFYKNRELSLESRSAEERTSKEGNFVNIRDIPSAVAEKVMDKTSSNTRAVHTVQKKCLQWLNSLDNDDSS
ncbi:hypothetical protein LSH36_605g01019 [Paralvinella palmiformis]|uniref:Uncharacterized protein n=1 Tax=Paralvinella palmiformis TaxID=53620 RepID=A0AAD9MUP8_9ANNE|nr:hypothetical protein LSH36_605g01019 [Paralvinella palmiformis]